VIDGLRGCAGSRVRAGCVAQVIVAVIRCAHSSGYRERSRHNGPAPVLRLDGSVLLLPASAWVEDQELELTRIVGTGKVVVGELPVVEIDTMRTGLVEPDGAGITYAVSLNDVDAVAGNSHAQGRVPGEFDLHAVVGFSIRNDHHAATTGGLDYRIKVTERRRTDAETSEGLEYVTRGIAGQERARRLRRPGYARLYRSQGQSGNQSDGTGSGSSETM